MIASVDPWSTATYESYPSYATTSKFPLFFSHLFASIDPFILFADYVPTYPTQQQQQQQQQYHANTRHGIQFAFEKKKNFISIRSWTISDSYGYDKDYFNQYGQTRPTTTNTNELSTSSQSTKEGTFNSKLSATAASFSQATSPTGTVFINQPLYPYSTFYPSQQDRTMTYPSMDTRVSSFFFPTFVHDFISFPKGSSKWCCFLCW